MALVLDIAALLVGLSDHGWGWAFSTVAIFILCAIALVFACIAAILTIVTLARYGTAQRSAWFALVLAVISALAALFLYDCGCEAVASV